MNYKRYVVSRCVGRVGRGVNLGGATSCDNMTKVGRGRERRSVPLVRSFAACRLA